MSERCQTKLAENNSNQNYIIYTGIFALLVAILYIYRFHFATIVVSYALGCSACYFGLKSSALQEYLEKLKQNHLRNSQTAEQDEVLTKGCSTCGSSECSRHSPTTAEPWAGLRVHKQLDQAIEDFYNTILDQFVNSWYSKISTQPFFVDELRHQLRYASACLLRRAVKINYSRFITERLLPCAMRHYTLCADLPDNALLDSKLAIHPAAANRNAELKYLRSITNAIMPYLLKNHDLENSVFRVLIREIFAGWVLLSLTDVLADPYILNTLIVLATGEETMAQLPTTPNYRVEFLETFVRHTDSVYTQRAKLLRIDLDTVLNEQEFFYAFMQHMKTTSHLHLLQFYKDIKSFQTKILNPDLQPNEQVSLINEAWDIYVTYFDSASPSYVQLDPSLGVELRSILADQADSIKRLQTSRALYQAARQSHAALEKTMLPRFLHSEEFYKLVVGSRIPTGYQKQLTKKQQENLVNSALRLTNKLRGALKSQTIDGQVLESYSNSSTEASEDSLDIDILKYLDTIASEESLREQDLSTFKVVLTNVETRLQAPPRRGTVRVFTLAVHRADTLHASASFWSVERSEHDFHLLRAKLHEFHGERPLHDLPLPSRRDNSPMETLRYKYEDFIQRLLQKSILQTSELLHLFLTVDGDFSLVVQASSLSATSTDFANIYQSVTHKLRKEKGQHLESFLRNYLISSDVERFQAIKLPHVEEALEVNEEIESQEPQVATLGDTRDIHSSVFEDNFGVEPSVLVGSTKVQDDLAGFSQCLMYLLSRIVKARSAVTRLVGSALSMTRDVADDLFNSVLDATLRDLLCERRLAHLITLGQGLIFGKKSSPRVDPQAQSSAARAKLLRVIPNAAATVAGAGLAQAVSTAFDLIQRPKLNKQLVYNLLDLCLMELFPELAEESKVSEPKS